MADATTDVALRITVKDVNSPQAAKAVEQGFGQAQKRMREEAEKTGKATEQIQAQMVSRSVTEFRKLSSARETLGVRSEQAVRREIQQTEAAYNRLMRSGELSAKQLARAQEAARQKTIELNKELGKSPPISRGRAVAGGAAVVAGGAAGAYAAVREPASRAMSYEERLANLANTAFKDADLPGRQVGMQQLEAAVVAAVRSGGGTREGATDALESLLGRGTLGQERSLAFLPHIMKTARGNKVDPKQIADLVSVLVGQGYVSTDDELKVALNMATAGGQEGGAELNKMAAGLAQQLPYAKKSGLIGLDGLQKVITMNQAAVMTAGSPDEATRNVVNLLAKLTSSDTANDFKKAGRGDLADLMIRKREKGVDAISVWEEIIDGEISKDPRLKAAVGRLNKAGSPEERSAAMEAVTALTEGSVVGKYFQDMQATSALMGLRNTNLVARVDAEIGKNRKPFGANDLNFSLISETSAYWAERVEQEKLIGQKVVLDKALPGVKSSLQTSAELMQSNPATTGALSIGVPMTAGGLTAAGLMDQWILKGALRNASVDFLKTRALPVAGRALSSAYAPAAAALVLGGDTKKSSGVAGPSNPEWVEAQRFLNEQFAQAEEKRRLAGEMSHTPPEARMSARIELALPPGMTVARSSMQTTGNGNVQLNTGNIWNGAPR